MAKILTGKVVGIYSLVVNLIALLPILYAYAFIKNISGYVCYIMVVLMQYGLFGFWYIYESYKN